MSQARKFFELEGTSREAAEDLEEKGQLEINQDWDDKRTMYAFPDGSSIIFGPDGYEITEPVF